MKIECETCSGDGISRCSNPDHGGIHGGLYGDDNARIGCPVCGHDELHRVHNEKCEDCNGTGFQDIPVKP